MPASVAAAAGPDGVAAPAVPGGDCGKAFHGLTEEVRACRLAGMSGMSGLAFIHTGRIFGPLAQADQVESSR